MTLTIEDNKAVEVARVVEAANRCARERGYDIATTLITITQSVDGTFWEIHYGPRIAVGGRGGDMSVEVDAVTAKVKRVLLGQ